MIYKFSAKTKENLKTYVYILSDPDTKEPFYIGKGKNDRVFDHLKESGDNKKVKKLEELRKQGKQPYIEILAHGMDNETAEWVEMAAIDLIGKAGLTNQQRGNKSVEFGRVSAEKLDMLYSAEKISISDFEENAVLLKLNNTYHPDITSFELYEATRGYWCMDIERAIKFKYVMPIYEGVILEVYQVTQWFKAGATLRTLSSDNKLDGRLEFVGKVAEEDIRKKYVGKSVENIVCKNQQNPIRYIEHGIDFEE